MTTLVTVKSDQVLIKELSLWKSIKARSSYFTIVLKHPKNSMDQLESDIHFSFDNELGSYETEKLKLSLEERMDEATSTKCAETVVQTLEDFTEMERECIVSPANFGSMKTALETVSPSGITRFEEEQEGSKAINSCQKDEFQIEKTEENIQPANKRVSSEGAVLCQITEKAKVAFAHSDLQRVVGTKAKPTSPLPGTDHGKRLKLTLAAEPIKSKINGNGFGNKLKEHVNENTTSQNSGFENVKTKETALHNPVAEVTSGTPTCPTRFFRFQGTADEDVVTYSTEQIKTNMQESQGMVPNKTLCKGEIVPSGDKDSPLHPTDNLSLLSNCYNKAGYSVLVSNGSLCEITSEMGLVDMENGTAFHIAVQNNNDYAVEVDVTFSGRFLGFWTLDAQQSYPLIIEGSTWENGKLTFISEPSETEYGVLSEPNGKIELEFKPEAMVLFVRHLRTEKRHEVLLTDFKLATVGDLREEINRTLWDQLGCITCLIKDGKVLDELQFIRSYFLKNGDIIEILTSEEPILIKPCHMDPFTLWVDPCYDSIDSVREMVATKMNVNGGNLSLLQEGEHIAERRGPLTNVFLRSRKPVLKAIKVCSFINITVHLPSKVAKRVRISWFATVDELKRCLNIPTSGTLLKVGDREIQDSTGLKELIDLGIQNESEVIVTYPTESGANSCRDPSHESVPEELADNASHSLSPHILGCSSEFNPEDMYGISSHFNNMEWIGQDESFCGCYQLDNRYRRFTNDRLKSVTLVVQLSSKRSVSEMLS